METALVIGANGFIGSYLCQILLNNGINVIGTAKNINSDTSVLIDCINNHKFKLVYCDIHNITTLEPSLYNIKVDTIYYLAWQGITGNSRSDCLLQIDNIQCMINTITFVKKLNCKRFIGIGSLAEIDSYTSSCLEGNSPSPVSQYGIAKLSAHHMSKILCNELEIEHIWAVIGNTYGIGDKSSNFINYAINKISSQEPNDFTSGEQFYDFVHVCDVAEALYYIGLSGKKNNSYYVGSNSPQKLKYYITTIRDIICPSAQLNLGAIPFKGFFQPLDTFDCSKLIKHTGFTPKIKFEDGIAELINYIR